MIRGGEIIANSPTTRVNLITPISTKIPRTKRHSFRLILMRCSNLSDIWTVGWEQGNEHAGVLPVVGDACVVDSYPAITGYKEDSDSAGTELGELFADPLGIGFWDGLFVVCV